MTQEEIFIFWVALPILLEITAAAGLVCTYFAPAPEPKYEQAREAVIANSKMALIAIPVIFGISVWVGSSSFFGGWRALVDNRPSIPWVVRARVDMPAGTVLNEENLQTTHWKDHEYDKEFLGKKTKRSFLAGQTIERGDVEVDASPAIP